MALTIVTQPDNYNYSGNPVTLEVVPGATYTSGVTGTKMVVEFNITAAAPVAGQKVKFSFNAQSVEFTFTDTYSITDAADTCPTKGSLTDLQWKVALLGAFFNNYFFAKHFQNVGGSIQIRCVEDSDDFTITTNATGAVVTVITAGVLPSVPDNYEIVCDVYSNRLDESASTLKASLSVKPPTTDPYHVAFYLEKILDSLLSVAPPTATTPYKVYDRYCRFDLNFAEKYGMPAVERAVNIVSVKYALKGKGNWLTMQAGGWSLNDNLGNFLTNAPNGMDVDAIAPQYLTFFNKTLIGELKLYVQVLWEDGSTSNHAVSNLDMTPNEMWVVPCGWSQLGITNGTLQPKHYIVSLAQYAAGVFSSHYTNQRIYYPKSCEGKYIVFHNQKCGIDTVKISDRVTIAIKSEKELLKRVWRMDSWPATEVYRKSSTKMIKAYTMPTDIVGAEWLMELALSKYVWEYTESGQYIPIIINTDSFQITDSKDDLFVLNFEYQQAIEL